MDSKVGNAKANATHANANATHANANATHANANATHANANVNVNVSKEINENNGYVSYWLNFALSEYQRAKEMVSSNKNVPPMVGTSLDKLEQLVAAAKNKSPIEMNETVKMLDNRVDAWLKIAYKRRDDARNKLEEARHAASTVPASMKQEAYKKVHEALHAFKAAEHDVKEAEAAELGKKIELQELIADARQIAWSGVEDMRSGKIIDRVQHRVTEGMDHFLERSEAKVDEYLPKSAEDEHDEILEATSEDNQYKNNAGIDSEHNLGKHVGSSQSRIRLNRAVNLSKTVTKRVRKRAFEKLSDWKARTSEVAGMDLSQYAEVIDSSIVNPVREKYAPLVDLTKKHASDLSHWVKKYQETASERIQRSYLGTYDFVLNAYSSISEKTNDIIAPSVDAVKTKFELLKLEVKKNQEDPEAPLTLESGLKALFKATQTTLFSEYEKFLKPYVEKVRDNTRKAAGVASNKTEA